MQRLDGFISLDARDKQGSVTTKTFVLRGKNVEINADAELAQSISAGSMLAVHDLGHDGKVIAVSNPIRSDGVALRPAWKQRMYLSDLNDRPVQLRLTLRYAKLNAFQFVDGRDD